MTTGLIIIVAFLLLAIVVVQISRINEIAKQLRGEVEAERRSNDRQGKYLFGFMVVFLLATVYSAWHYKNYFLGYGPHTAASEHGPSIDKLFLITLVITGIVFIITHIALFYFAYKYKHRPEGRASFMPHDNKLEIIWTAIPAFAMFALVINGLVVWNKVMADVDPDEEYMEIEAMGYQFAWALRYPGPDGKLGSRNYKLINGVNPMGQDWQDLKNLDDFQPGELVLPKGKKIRVRITARDVLHDFYLPQFRVKMDAVPGLPTYFVFTPTKTTEEYREELSKYPEYQVPYDPADPTGPKKWEAFEYELACAELCGSGHYSMKKIVKIVEQDEYDAWARQQKSFYFSSIRGTDEDPYTDQLFDFEIQARKAEFDDALNAAIAAPTPDERILSLKYVFFETGSATLTPLSKYELDNLVAAMKERESLNIEVGGHTDNTGNTESNQALSQQRADVVSQYLTNAGIDASRVTAVGYGQEKPRDTNDTDEGRANNRRTEIKITNS
ncbi:MAG: OmpA family protein [Saprospiraceae bacterium]|nr:OmpA family protein [Saprospiraceae bacterium]